MIKEGTKRIFDYVKEAHDKEYNITAEDIATALDLPIKSVNGSISAMQRMKIVARVPAVVQLDDGTEKSVKFIELTEAGLDWDYNAVSKESATAETL